MLPKLTKIFFKTTVNVIAAIVLVVLAGVCLWAIYAPGDNINDNWTAVIIAIIVSLALYCFSQLFFIASLLKRHMKYEGMYRGYSYKKNGELEDKEEEYNQLDEEPVSTVALKYCGENRFTINLWNPEGEKSNSTHEWQGELVVTSENMGDIAFHYTKPEKLINSVGYKRAVLFDSGTSTKIYMFSTDKQRFGREVLVKQ